MKKASHAIFLGIIIPLLVFYFFIADALKSYVFLGLQNFARGGPQLSKVLFISDDFDLRDYNNLIDKLSTAKNSAVLFLPQVFNVKIEAYLDYIDPDTVRIQKEEYEKFVIKIAEADNLIPVALLSQDKDESEKINLTQFSYFDLKKIKVNPPLFDRLKIKSKRIWYASKVVGFYRDYSYYPYKVPLLFKNNNGVLVNAVVEAVRKYYKMTKSYVKFDDSRLYMGSIINQPVLKSGEIIIRKPESPPKIYTRDQVLALDPEKLSNKIIVVKSGNISEHTMLSLGVAAESVLNGTYVRYNAWLNYLLAAVIAAVFFFAYRALRFRLGIIILALFELLITGAVVLALNSSYYIDFALLTGANVFVFVAVYYYYLWRTLSDRLERHSVIARYLHPASAKSFIKKNRDIRMRNSWVKSTLLYIDIDPQAAATPEEAKKLFEKVRQLVYNKEKEFIIKALAASSFAVVFADEDIEPKYLLETAFYLREELSGVKLNILVSATEYYIFPFNGELVILDKNSALREAALKLEKTRAVLIPEAAIQKYVGIIKFQKIPARDGVSFFNAAGFREETSQ